MKLEPAELEEVEIERSIIIGEQLADNLLPNPDGLPTMWIIRLEE